VRGETFVTRKITRALARIKLGLQDCLFLGNLSARRDWGHAKDYVEMQWLMLQQEKPEDFVIATGVQYSVRDFVNAAAVELGMKIRWEGSGVERTANFLKDKNVTVVSAFNNISAASLTNIEEDVECDCLISGDNHESKIEVMTLAEKIPGVRAVDCGPLENARIVEKITPLLIHINIRNRIKLAGIRITGLPPRK